MGFIKSLFSPAEAARRGWERADRDQARAQVRTVTDGNGLSKRGTPTRAAMPTCEVCGKSGKALTVRRGKAACKGGC